MSHINGCSTFLKLSVMKTFLLLLMCITFSMITLGQERNLTGPSISRPKFVGVKGVYPVAAQTTPGTIENYMSTNIQFPEKAIQNLTQGTCVVQYVVTEKGTLADFKVLNSVSKEIDNEVIRILKTTDGMWTPSLFNNEEPVAMEQEISIAFKNSELGNYTDFVVLGRKKFSKGSELFFMKNNPKKALRFYDEGVVLLPKDKGLLLVRGMARYEVGDMKGACQDWNRIKVLGGLESDYYLNNLCGYKGYAQMIEILKQ